MKITFTKQVQDSHGYQVEIDVENWTKAEHAIIDCDCIEELVEAGKWIAKHQRTISAYDIYEVANGNFYIEIWKK